MTPIIDAAQAAAKEADNMAITGLSWSLDGDLTAELRAAGAAGSTAEIELGSIPPYPVS